MEETQESIYSAEMKYSAETIRRLCELQYNTFNYTSKLVQTVGGIVFIVMGLLLGKDRLGLIVLALGCFTVVSLNFSSKTTAEQLCRRMNGKFPQLEYSISENGVITQQMDKETRFNKLIRLVEDGRYLYLFVDQHTVFMIDASSIKGEGGKEGLKKFLKGKTGLEWKKPFTILGTNVAMIKEGITLSKSGK